jgi:hypothetical protein
MFPAAECFQKNEECRAAGASVPSQKYQRRIRQNFISHQDNRFSICGTFLYWTMPPPNFLMNGTMQDKSLMARMARRSAP